ncbi:GNAT family N-acetyltransferase [Baekduia sp. Peel2402]|uniref:GNAT family N-acetyltransferase n=1 Tax=Baekduia sp. Peel2402 TaxID=3458296 RepID=UPI00403E867E
MRLTRRCDETHRAWAGASLAVPDEAAEELEWELRLARSGAWVTVAENEDDDAASGILGVCALAGAQAAREDPTPVPGLAHVSALFVDPDHWRRGIARTLLGAADDAMRAAGYSRAQLWTLAGSPAEQLYRALGWAPDGRRDVFAPMDLETVAYVKALD